MPYNQQVAAFLSLPHFAPIDIFVGPEVVEALRSRTWSRKRDDDKTVLTKNLIALYQLINSLQDCYPDNDDVAETREFWDHVQKLWCVDAAQDWLLAIKNQLNVALTVVNTFNQRRERYQLAVEDRMDKAREPEGPLIPLLLQLIHENMRFARTRKPAHVMPRLSMVEVLDIRTKAWATIVQDVGGCRKKLFEEMWASSLTTRHRTWHVSVPPSSFPIARLT